MKIIFIQPPVRDFYGTPFRQYPLGLLYLAASARKAGHSVAILDAARCSRPKRIAPPPELRYLDEFYTKVNGLFLNYKHFGLDHRAIEDAVRRFRPDIACIGSMFTPYHAEAIETAKAVKRVSSGIVTIAGGFHATADPASLIGSGAFDHVIRGEGESIFADLDALSSGIHPSADAPPLRIDRLDELPFPARDIMNADDYRFEGRRYGMVITSRGCPHSCSFCSVHAVAGHAHRKRSAESVTAEIDECVKRYGITAIDLQDDNLLFDRDHAAAILGHLARRNERGDLLLLASNGLNVCHLDRELLVMMKRAGFRKLDLALGTGDVRSREGLRRPETMSEYENILAICGEIGLPATTYVILGLPDQPLSEMRETFEYLRSKPTLISPSIFYNVPGMPFFEEMKRYEYNDAHIARRSSAFNNFGKDFTREDIFALFKEIREHNLSKS